MNIDVILKTLNEHQVDYLLIGGVNYLLNHEPELTYDVDIWIHDAEENKRRLIMALRSMDAEWGRTEKEWGPIPETTDWLNQQTIFCLTSKYGALDIFREVKGLEGRYDECKKACKIKKTAVGISYPSLSDQHMLESQLALAPQDQKLKRIEVLRASLTKSSS